MSLSTSEGTGAREGGRECKPIPFFCHLRGRIFPKVRGVSNISRALHNGVAIVPRLTDAATYLVIATIIAPRVDDSACGMTIMSL